MPARSVEIGEIFGEAKSLVQQHAGYLAAVLAAVSLGYIGLDWLTTQSTSQGGVTFLSSISGLFVSLFVQYLVTERLLLDRKPEGAPRAARRYWPLFLAGLMSGAAIALGAVLLVLPGIYLAGRWLTYSAQLIDRELGASEALSASWQDSEPSQLAFCIAAVAGFMPAIVMVGGMVVWSDYVLSDALPAIAFLDGLSALTSLTGWIIGVAAYRLAEPAADPLGHVFA